MEPNADFVPIYAATSRKGLTIKTYDRLGRAVRYSESSGARAGTVSPGRVFH